MSFAPILADLEAEIEQLIGKEADGYERLAESMRYSALAGGKRLRALLIWQACELFDVEAIKRQRVAAAIELVHAYSLIHDDLPAMDDAETRRGRPANHIAFDEATAILAGDALQTLAFDALARPDWSDDAEERCVLVGELARAAGLHGMCGGQMLDLLAESVSLDLDGIERLQALKTGALFGFCCRSAGILGAASVVEIAALDRFAGALGLAFQIQDDLLDLTGDATKVGKDLGRDVVLGKATFPSLLGIDEAKLRLDALRDEAVTAMSGWGDKARPLLDLMDVVISRES